MQHITMHLNCEMHLRIEIIIISMITFLQIMNTLQASDYYNFTQFCQIFKSYVKLPNHRNKWNKSCYWLSPHIKYFIQSFFIFWNTRNFSLLFSFARFNQNVKKRENWLGKMLFKLAAGGVWICCCILSFNQMINHHQIKMENVYLFILLTSHFSYDEKFSLKLVSWN